MWTPTTRRQHSRAGTRYETDFNRRRMGADRAVHARAVPPLSGRAGAGAADLPLQLDHLQGKLLIPGLKQEGIETAPVLDRAQRLGAEAEPNHPVERVA